MPRTRVSTGSSRQLTASAARIGASLDDTVRASQPPSGWGEVYIGNRNGRFPHRPSRVISMDGSAGGCGRRPPVSGRIRDRRVALGAPQGNRGAQSRDGVTIAHESSIAPEETHSATLNREPQPLRLFALNANRFFGQDATICRRPRHVQSWALSRVFSRAAAVCARAG
jgi:hypothetical protein